LRGLVRCQTLETIQWFISITHKQQEASIGVFYAIILHIVCQYRRPNVLRVGLTLTSPDNYSFFFKMACNIVTDNNDIPCLDVLRRYRRWEAMYAFRHAAACNNQLIFRWLHKTCPLETYDDLIYSFPMVSDWLKVIDSQ
jgi:hypothetical protein